MALEFIGVNRFHTADPRNRGVLADEFVATSRHVMMRRITCVIR